MPWEQHLLLFVEGILAVSSPSSLDLVCQVCWVLCTEGVWVPFILVRKRDYAGHL